MDGENSCKCSRPLHYNSIYKYVETELRWITRLEILQERVCTVPKNWNDMI